jgi:hypothetical protein
MAAHPEDWQKAADRVAGEVLGRTFLPQEFPKSLCEIKDYEQSDADGVWKLYTIQVFGLELPKTPLLAPGMVGEWLSAANSSPANPSPVPPVLSLPFWRNEICYHRGGSIFCCPQNDPSP